MAEEQTKNTLDWKSCLTYWGIGVSAVGGVLTGAVYLMHRIQIGLYGTPLGIVSDISGNVLYSYAAVLLLAIIPVLVLTALLVGLSHCLKRAVLHCWRKCKFTPLSPVPPWLIMVVLLFSTAAMMTVVQELSTLTGLFWQTWEPAQDLGLLTLVLNPNRAEKYFIISAALITLGLNIWFLIRLFLLYRHHPHHCRYVLSGVAIVTALYSLFSYITIQAAMFPDIGTKKIPYVRMSLQPTPKDTENTVKEFYLVGQNTNSLVVIPAQPDIHSYPLTILPQNIVHELNYIGKDKSINQLLCERWRKQAPSVGICKAKPYLHFASHTIMLKQWMLYTYILLALAIILMLPSPALAAETKRLEKIDGST